MNKQIYHIKLNTKNNTEITIPNLSYLKIKVIHISKFQSVYCILLSINNIRVTVTSNTFSPKCILSDDNITSYCVRFIKLKQNSIIVEFSHYIFPTNIIEIDIPILLNLEDEMLYNMCSSNKYFASICNDKEFWRLKLSQYFNVNLKFENVNLKELYKDISISKDKSLEKSLILCIQYKYISGITYLLNQTLDINYNNGQIIIAAMYEKNINIIKMILSSKHQIQLDLHVRKDFIFEHYITEHENELFKLLFSYVKKEYFNQRDWGKDWLFTATCFENIEILEFLLSKGINLHMDEDQAFIIAVYYNLISSIKWLLSPPISLLRMNRTQGANINAQDGQALLDVINNNNIELLTFLIEKGLDIHVQNNLGLIEAVRIGSTNIVNLLVNHGMNINTNGSIALYEAVRNNNLDMVKFLIEEMNINVHVHDDEILLETVKFNNVDIVEYLLSPFIGIDIKKQLQDIYFELEDKENENMIDVLFSTDRDREIDLNYENDYLFRLMVHNNNTRIVKYLVRMGANVDANDGEALLDAISNNNIVLIKFLINNGISLNNIRNEVLPTAITSGNYEVLELFLKEGFDPTPQYNYLKKLIKMHPRETRSLLKNLIDKYKN